MASSPTNRVRYLLDLPLDTNSYREPVTKTPTTLTGGDHGLYSYRLCIAWRDGDDWLVTNEKNSPTTNRHIAAVHRVLDMEYQKAGEETVTVSRKAPYDFYRDTPITVTRYQPYR